MWAGEYNNVPFGWLLCDGTLYDWNQYTRLRSAIGTTYGGSINTNWNVPNMSTKVPEGVAGGGSRGSLTLNVVTTSTAHSHNAGGPYTSNNSTETSNHYHHTFSTGSHTHNLDAVNANHSHVTAAPDGTGTQHTHPITGGNTSATTGADGHGYHNGYDTVSYGNHPHSLPAAGAAHEHGLANVSESHTHANWGGTGVEYSSGGSSHQHNFNTQRIYYIIKF